MNLSTILYSVAILLLAGSHAVDGFWRLMCHGTLGTARIDPIQNFGQVAPHAHQIAGASNIGFFTDAADLQASNCTSCEIVQDKSAYWTPALYFQHDNGSFELVQTQGGMLVYYFNNNVAYLNDSSGNEYLSEPLAAFPPDFRMVAGNNSLRDFPYIQPDREMSDWQASDKTQPALTAKAIGFNCLHYLNNATEGSMEFHYLRNKTFLDATCTDGVRFEIEFPSCWDGVRLDSEDHKSHILYPENRISGDCPDGFKVRTPVLFFETIWRTEDFVGQSGTFVIANGDTEGYGYHGDFYSGWNQTFLQNAINTCLNLTGNAQDCHQFTLQDDSISTSCFLDMPAELRHEDYQGPIPSLPGNVAISTGPGLAAKLEGTPVTGTTRAPAPTTLPSSSTFGQGTVGGGSSVASSSLASSSLASSSVASPKISNNRPPASVTPISSCAPPAQAPGTLSATDYPATTAAPSPDDNSSLSIATTSTYTSDGHEVHEIIYEEMTTITDVVKSPKRHAHKHGKAHAHGHL